MATNDRVGGRPVPDRAQHRGRSTRARTPAIGARVTVAGYHKNYRPVLAEIDRERARLVNPFLPDAPPHWVRLKDVQP